jgi:pimeloyl-ACP methyl ester carboxylesterase
MQAHLGDGTITYDRAGKGDSVVLSHASLVDRRMWHSQLRVLSQTHDVVAFDQLGYGGSSSAPHTVRPAETLIHFLDTLGIERATLIGCSMGGGYSLDAALLAPDRVSALVLICSGIPGYEWPEAMRAETRDLLASAVPLERLQTYLAHTADVVRDDDIAAMAEAQARYMAVGPGRTPDVFAPAAWESVLDMARGVFGRMWREPASTDVDPEPPILDRLGEVAVPTLVINGTADVRYIQQISRLLASGIPDARAVDLVDTAHLPPMERPDETNAAILDFLAR